MPPKKSNYGRKSAKAKQMEKIRNNLSAESKEKLLEKTRESMQKYRANVEEENLEDIQLQDMYSHQNHR
jgi:gamma-glutamyl phosphate reductase